MPSRARAVGIPSPRSCTRSATAPSAHSRRRSRCKPGGRRSSSTSRRSRSRSSSTCRSSGRGSSARWSCSRTIIRSSSRRRVRKMRSCRRASWVQRAEKTSSCASRSISRSRGRSASGSSAGAMESNFSSGRSRCTPKRISRSFIPTVPMPTSIAWRSARSRWMRRAASRTPRSCRTRARRARP